MAKLYYDESDSRFLTPPPKRSIPTCPNCGEETDEFYQDENNAIIGCPNCIRTIDAWEYAYADD